MGELDELRSSEVQMEMLQVCIAWTLVIENGFPVTGLFINVSRDGMSLQSKVSLNSKVVQRMIGVKYDQDVDIMLPFVSALIDNDTEYAERG